VVTYDSAIWYDELYVWDGGAAKSRFVHALSAISELSEEQRASESAIVKEWIQFGSPMYLMPKSITPPKSVPAWRANAWTLLLLTGKI